MPDHGDVFVTDSDQNPAGAADGLDRRIVRNSAWVGLSYGGGQLASFAAMLVLSRLLTPSEFGVMALATTLVAVLSHVQESGIGAALVHLRDDLRARAASGLAFSAASGASLALAVAALAPAYGALVKNDAVVDVVRVLGVLLLLRGLTVVPNAILERDLAFRTRVWSELAGYGVQAGVSVALAVAGLGAWSLVAGVLAGSAVQAAVVWLLVPWRPSIRDARWTVLRPMLRYGRFVSVANLMNVVNTSMDNVAVGRFLGSAAVGAYGFAWRLAELPVTVIGPIVGRVMFSVYSLAQDDLPTVRRAYLQNVQRTVLFGLPPMVALAAAADPIVPALLGPQWQAAETPLRILSAFAFVRLIAGPAGELFKGIGKPHLPLLATAIFTVAGIASLVVVVPRHGAPGAALSMLLAIVLSTASTFPMLLRELRLRPVALASTLARPIACSLPLGATLLLLRPTTDALSPIAALAVLAAVSIPVYVVTVATVGRPIVAPVVAALRRH